MEEKLRLLFRLYCKPCLLVGDSELMAKPDPVSHQCQRSALHNCDAHKGDVCPESGVELTEEMLEYIPDENDLDDTLSNTMATITHVRSGDEKLEPVTKPKPVLYTRPRANSIEENCQWMRNTELLPKMSFVSDTHRQRERLCVCVWGGH